ncbi:Low molecular weight protein-tyrosine-phosphatase YfkJ [Chryseobacterium aquaeductus]|uniref:protein-tyrosine-phosphatase n=2 Tax=Chryseobacterium aquaeductus TaxID=2675056 RepID=A0A9N8MIR5_9FLAO|nr:Low molecular weight protein-tyrosine-phosphatase YfkJ [Chryseobacterium potabilaquae]CAD7816863.1 Low molecular weight protein-tyrosine-phosphatase YfkJ [Chryseobacterium aquaeductus]
MVCLGNICRSPLAEGIMKSKLPENFLVDSAGTIDMHKGGSPDKRSVKIAEKYGLNISKQCSRPVTIQDLDDFDKIFCMDLNNLKDVLSLAQNEKQKAKISLLMEVADLKHFPTEVPDPYWSELDGFEKVYHQLDEACEKIAKKLLISQAQNS